MKLGEGGSWCFKIKYLLLYHQAQIKLEYKNYKTGNGSKKERNMFSNSVWLLRKSERKYRKSKKVNKTETCGTQKNFSIKFSNYKRAKNQLFTQYNVICWQFSIRRTNLFYFKITKDILVASHKAKSCDKV